jgi:preprotein translocase subunit SecG
MSIFIGFLTAILILNSLFLILLILIQLPKKEAGAGVAFGGGATEALFGAGSGTVLTKVTKYCAGIFMVLALVLSVLNSQRARESARALDQELEAKAAAAPALTNAPVALPVAPALQLTTTNVPPAAAPALPAPTNVPAAP